MAVFRFVRLIKCLIGGLRAYLILAPISDGIRRILLVIFSLLCIIITRPYLIYQPAAVVGGSSPALTVSPQAHFSPEFDEPIAYFSTSFFYFIFKKKIFAIS